MHFHNSAFETYSAKQREATIGIMNTLRKGDSKMREGCIKLLDKSGRFILVTSEQQIANCHIDVQRQLIQGFDVLLNHKFQSWVQF